ncbi:MAG: lipid-A-disaccharide synthase [Hyphomicrobiales bacterium]|nr:lipid-A-disaccharide synthase [Hyphomicrobiales bacterium]
MTGPAARPLDVFLVAGEPSGDQLGYKLMRALRGLAPGVQFRGVGGEAMVREGLETAFPMSDIAVMGLMPVIRRLPLLLRRIRETADAIIARPPDILVIIDSPDFTHRVAHRVRARLPHLRIVDYVSPTVWAWRPGRAPAMRAYVDHVLALLPFEPAAHARLGGPPCAYVGHPLIERLADLRPNAQEAAARASDPPTLVVLPGSRRAEIERLMEPLERAVDAVAQRVGPLDVVLPAVTHLEPLIRAKAQSWAHPPRIVLGEAEKYAAFRRARAALAVSGTVTLELALAQVPMVVAYRVSRVEALARFLVTAPSIVLPNLILGENVIPELIQEACTPERLADALAPLLAGGPERARQEAALVRLDGLMSLAGGETPSACAARMVLAAAAA